VALKRSTEYLCCGTGWPAGRKRWKIRQKRAQPLQQKFGTGPATFGKYGKYGKHGLKHAQRAVRALRAPDLSVHGTGLRASWWLRHREFFPLLGVTSVHTPCPTPDFTAAPLPASACQRIRANGRPEQHFPKKRWAGPTHQRTSYLTFLLPASLPTSSPFLFLVSFHAEPSWMGGVEWRGKKNFGVCTDGYLFTSVAALGCWWGRLGACHIVCRSPNVDALMAPNELTFRYQMSTFACMR